MFIERKDQMNRVIRLGAKPSRIISLVPSQTEFLHYLGLEEEVIGITKFCIHPDEWFQSKKRVGGTKQVSLSVVRELQPDLVLANKEENTQSDVLELEKIAPVWISDVNDKTQAYEMMRAIASLVGKSDLAEQLIEEVEVGLSECEDAKRFTYLYFMWKDPYFTVGPATFIHNWLSEFGGVNLQTTPRYPEYDFSQNDSPEVVFISTEPFPFNGSHIAFFQTQFPNSKIVIVDGEMASWYGSKMREATIYFKDLIATQIP